MTKSNCFKLVLCAVFSFISIFSTAAFAEELTLKFAHTSGPRTPIYDTYELFKDLVEEKSKGTIKVNLYPSAQLGGDVQTAEAVLKNALDVASVGTNNMAPFTKLYFWADLPFIYNDMNGVHKVYGGPFGNEYKQKLEDETDFKVLFYTNPGSFRVLMNTVRPVRTPKDMEGLKFRSAPSPVEMDTVRALGANPTPINWPETYMALEQKVVDGEMQQYQWAISAKHQEVIKYVTEIPGQHALHLVVVNKNKFASYSPEAQKIILEAAQEAQDYNFKNTEKMNDKLRKELMDAGGEIYYATPEEIKVWREAALPVWKKYEQDVPAAIIEKIQKAQQ